MPQINIDGEKVTIDGVEYAPVKKEDTRHLGRYNKYISTSTDGGILKVIYDLGTWELAYKEEEKIKAIHKIKQYISDTFGVFEPDWSDDEQRKYVIFYNHDDEEFRCTYITGSYYTRKHQRSNFSCEEHGDIIIEKFDKELRIIGDIE